MKLTPLTREELQWLRWKVWEPMRRNDGYRNEFSDLLETHFLDKAAIDKFCDKWRLNFPIHPGTEFNQITAARSPWLVNVFSGCYLPPSDPAAFVSPAQCITDDDYLCIFIDPTYSRNQIKIEFQKILREWLPRAARFFGIKRTRRPAGEVLRQAGTVGKHTAIRVNLRATRRLIEKSFSLLLREIATEKPKHNLPRLHPEKLSECFRAHDLAAQRFTSAQIAEKIGVKSLNTAERMIIRAERLIESFCPDLEYEECEKPARRRKRRPHRCGRTGRFVRFGNPDSAKLTCKRCRKPSKKLLCPSCTAEFKRWMELTDKRLAEAENIGRDSF